MRNPSTPAITGYREIVLSLLFLGRTPGRWSRLRGFSLPICIDRPDHTPQLFLLSTSLLLRLAAFVNRFSVFSVDLFRMTGILLLIGRPADGETEWRIASHQATGSLLALAKSPRLRRWAWWGSFFRRSVRPRMPLSRLPIRRRSGFGRTARFLRSGSSPSSSA